MKNCIAEVPRRNSQAFSRNIITLAISNIAEIKVFEIISASNYIKVDNIGLYSIMGFSIFHQPDVGRSSKSAIASKAEL